MNLSARSHQTTDIYCAGCQRCRSLHVPSPCHAGGHERAGKGNEWLQTPSTPPQHPHSFTCNVAALLGAVEWSAASLLRVLVLRESQDGIILGHALACLYALIKLHSGSGRAARGFKAGYFTIYIASSQRKTKKPCLNLHSIRPPLCW